MKTFISLLMQTICCELTVSQEVRCLYSEGLFAKQPVFGLFSIYSFHLGLKIHVTKIKQLVSSVYILGLGGGVGVNEKRAFYLNS